MFQGHRIRNEVQESVFQDLKIKYCALKYCAFRGFNRFQVLREPFQSFKLRKSLKLLL